ncbi:MAG: hypothetical protein HC781_04275 [Leptolyngbyaceae cyanobacterium CSU_1_4]|nr:hypothetical protein [Leptolyngbyaceae cyanobacterium CSU_1_4]
MADQTSSASIPTTPQELEQALQRYRNSDLSDFNNPELFNQWLAIRTAALEQKVPDIEDQVPGEDSY